MWDWSNQMRTSKNIVPKQTAMLSKRINWTFCVNHNLRFQGLAFVLCCVRTRTSLSPRKTNPLLPLPPSRYRIVPTQVYKGCLLLCVFFSDGYRSKGRNGNALDFFFFFGNLSELARVETAYRSSWLPSHRSGRWLPVGVVYEKYINRARVHFALGLIVCTSLMLW